MADSTRIRLTEKRERLYSNLEEVTGENTRSKSLDLAAREYVKLRGGTTARPTGKLQTLMQEATEKGSLTPEEIAEILDTPELPVAAETEYSVGRDT